LIYLFINSFSDVNKIKDAIGDKLGANISYMSTFFSGLIIAFIKGWKLTLVVMSISPILFVLGFTLTKVKRQQN
jgi:ATP-binding cassette, subfamily B (MDR/TAP), member 1